MYTKVKSDIEIAAMRESGRQLAAVLKYLRQEIRAGISTKDLANMAAAKLKELGGRPAFLGYYGFPDVLCVSVNDEVVHGIPKQNCILKDGDIVSMDFGVVVDGMITDAAISVIVGKGSRAAELLVANTEKSLLAGIDQVQSGVRVGDISAAVEQELAKHGYGIVRDLVGHGVGHELHEEPNIPNYGHKKTGPILKTGMTIAIEPMATLGAYGVKVDSDGWTIRTVDGSLSAHFEHTVLITDDGAEILTLA